MWVKRQKTTAFTRWSVRTSSPRQKEPESEESLLEGRKHGRGCIRGGYGKEDKGKPEGEKSSILHFSVFTPQLCR